jgi:murein hydrolase activator
MIRIDWKVFIAVISIAPQVVCATETEQGRELSAVQSKIQAVGSELKSLSSEKTAQAEQLKKLEKQYGELANQLSQIKSKIRTQEIKLQEIRSKITGSQKDIQNQQRSLEGLIKSAYAMGGQEGFKLVLNQHDPSLSGRMLVYQDYISKARAQKLQAIQENYLSLQQLEAEKDAETQQLQESLDKKQQETSVMQELMAERETLLAQLENAYASKSAQMERLLHDEKKLASLLASLQKTDDNADVKPSVPAEIHSAPRATETIEKDTPVAKPKILATPSQPIHDFAELQGKLLWPVNGTIIEKFGSPRYETTWDGAVISAREGADIRAVAAGRVVFADWLRGYGLMLIVDHGKGYMSLYAFNQSLHKSVGEQVKTGEVLASAGRSGGRSQAALYFGIRQKGRPLNPEQWCRKSSKD